MESRSKIYLQEDDRVPLLFGIVTPITEVTAAFDLNFLVPGSSQELFNDCCCVVWQPLELLLGILPLNDAYTTVVSPFKFELCVWAKFANLLTPVTRAVPLIAAELIPGYRCNKWYIEGSIVIEKWIGNKVIKLSLLLNDAAMEHLKTGWMIQINLDSELITSRNKDAYISYQ